MELVILIVLLIGFLFIRSSDKISSASHDAIMERSKRSEEQFLSRMSDPDVFWDITDMLEQRVPSKTLTWDDIYKEIMAAYHEMGWEEIKSRLPGRSDAQDFQFVCLNRDYCNDIVRRILLANRGLLAEWDARLGISFDPIGRRSSKSGGDPFPSVQSGSGRDWLARQLASDKQLGHYIVKKLRENGVDDEAYFAPNLIDHSGKDAARSKIYRFGTEPDGMPGRLLFYPAIPEWDRKYIVN